MATKLAKIIADFRTSIDTALAIGGTTTTLQSITDDDGVTLPNGTYFFTLDGDNSQKEHIVCTLTGTALSAIKSVSRQGVQTVGVSRAHRIGASVVITNFAHIKYINDLLDGTTNLNAATPLTYDGTATITTPNQLATKDYVDGVAIAGAPKATETVYGISKLSVAAIDPLIPIVVGDNDTRLPTQNENNALVGTVGTPSGTNKFVTNDDTATTGAAVVLRSKANSKLDDSLLALTTAGDTTYSDGTDLQRLALGAKSQFYRTNSGLTAPTWGDGLAVATSLTVGEDLSSGNIVRIGIQDGSGDLRTYISQTAENSNFIIGATQRFAQSFTTPAGASERLYGFTFKSTDDSAGTTAFTMKVYADSAGSPGTEVYSEGFTFDFFGAGGGENTVTLTTKQTLTANTKYWIAFQCDNASGAIINMRYQNTSVLADAELATFDGASWSVSATADAYVKVFFTDTASRIYKGKATAQAIADATIGFVESAYSLGATNAAVISHGMSTGLSGITSGQVYYLSDTRGAIATSAGSVSKKVAVGYNTTQVISMIQF